MEPINMENHVNNMSSINDATDKSSTEEENIVDTQENTTQETIDANTAEPQTDANTQDTIETQDNAQQNDVNASQEPTAFDPPSEKGWLSAEARATVNNQRAARAAEAKRLEEQQKLEQQQKEEEAKRLREAEEEQRKLLIQQKELERKQRLEEEEAERQRLIAQQEAEAQRLREEQEKQKAETERLAKEKEEAERYAAEQAKAARIAKKEAEAALKLAEEAKAKQEEAERIARESIDAVNRKRDEEEAQRNARDQAEAEMLVVQQAVSASKAEDRAELRRNENYEPIDDDVDYIVDGFNEIVDDEIDDDITFDDEEPTIATQNTAYSGTWEEPKEVESDVYDSPSDDEYDEFSIDDEEDDEEYSSVPKIKYVDEDETDAIDETVSSEASYDETNEVSNISNTEPAAAAETVSNRSRRSRRSRSKKHLKNSGVSSSAMWNAAPSGFSSNYDETVDNSQQYSNVSYYDEQPQVNNEAYYDNTQAQQFIDDEPQQQFVDEQLRYPQQQEDVFDGLNYSDDDISDDYIDAADAADNAFAAMDNQSFDEQLNDFNDDYVANNEEVEPIQEFASTESLDIDEPTYYDEINDELDADNGYNDDIVDPLTDNEVIEDEYTVEEPISSFDYDNATTFDYDSINYDDEDNDTFENEINDIDTETQYVDDNYTEQQQFVDQQFDEQLEQPYNNKYVEPLDNQFDTQFDNQFDEPAYDEQNAYQQSLYDQQPQSYDQSFDYQQQEPIVEEAPKRVISTIGGAPVSTTSGLKIDLAQAFGSQSFNSFNKQTQEEPITDEEEFIDTNNEFIDSNNYDEQIDEQPIHQFDEPLDESQENVFDGLEDGSGFDGDEPSDYRMYGDRLNGASLDDVDDIINDYNVEHGIYDDEPDTDNGYINLEEALAASKEYEDALKASYEDETIENETIEFDEPQETYEQQIVQQIDEQIDETENEEVIETPSSNFLGDMTTPSNLDEYSFDDVNRIIENNEAASAADFDDEPDTDNGYINPEEAIAAAEIEEPQQFENSTRTGNSWLDDMMIEDDGDIEDGIVVEQLDQELDNIVTNEYGDDNQVSSEDILEKEEIETTYELSDETATEDYEDDDDDDDDELGMTAEEEKKYDEVLKNLGFDEEEIYEVLADPQEAAVESVNAFIDEHQNQSEAESEVEVIDIAGDTETSAEITEAESEVIEEADGNENDDATVSTAQDKIDINKFIEKRGQELDYFDLAALSIMDPDTDADDAVSRTKNILINTVKSYTASIQSELSSLDIPNNKQLNIANQNIEKLNEASTQFENNLKDGIQQLIQLKTQDDNKLNDILEATQETKQNNDKILTLLEEIKTQANSTNNEELAGIIETAIEKAGDKAATAASNTVIEATAFEMYRDEEALEKINMPNDNFFAAVNMISKTTANTNKAKVLYCLAYGELKAKDIVEITGLKQTTVTTQLKNLEKAGLAIQQKEGKDTYWYASSNDLSEAVRLFADFIKRNGIEELI